MAAMHGVARVRRVSVSESISPPVVRIRGNRKVSPTPSMATSSDYVDKTKEEVEAPPTAKAAPEASKDLHHLAPYAVNYQGANLWQDDPWCPGYAPGSSERTENTIPECNQATMHLRPSLGLHIHSKTCGLPAAATPQIYRPPEV